MVPFTVDDMKMNIFAEPVKVRKPAKPLKPPKQPKQPKQSSARQHIVKTEYAPQEDLLIEDEQEHHEEYIEPEVERYPVIDPARPFVCQRCGVSFAREKALLSHSKVSLYLCSYINKYNRVVCQLWNTKQNSPTGHQHSFSILFFFSEFVEILSLTLEN